MTVSPILSASQLATLAEHGEERTADVGDVLFRIGDERFPFIAILEQEVLTKQSADIDAVSGATFTSGSYDQSLQSALDKLGFKAADGSVAQLQVP